MEDEIKARFEGLDKRLEDTEKRFGDIKWFFGIVTIIIGLLTVMIHWNFNNERDSLKEFKKEIKEAIGKAESPAQLEILGIDRLPLKDKEIKVDFYTYKEKEKEVEPILIMRINHFISNIGETRSGPLFVKLYSSDPIRAESKSSDEGKFQYETWIPPNKVEPNELPGKCSVDWYHRIVLVDRKIPPNGKYPALIRVYYGNGKLAEAYFSLVVAIAEKERYSLETNINR